MTPKDRDLQLTQIAHEYLQQLRVGNFEGAFHNLLELGSDVVPLLMRTFEQHASPDVRSRILRVISEFRSPAALRIFASALRDPHSEVWRAALDGLVRLGSPAAAALLANAISEESQRFGPNSELLEWFREALQQTIEANA